MVDDIAPGRPDELAVHEDARVCSVAPADGALGVEHVLAFGLAEPPFAPAQALVVGRIDDGEAALRQRNPPEGVPVSHPAVQQNEMDQQPDKPTGKRQCERDLYHQPPQAEQ